MSQENDLICRLIARFARLGYAAKGITYLLLAWMVMRAAHGHERAANTRRAMAAFDSGNFSSLLLLLSISIGIGGYGLWKLFVAIRNPESDKWPKRVGSLFISAINGGLAYQASMLALTRAGHHGSGDQAAQWTALVMRYPLGIWAVGIAGVCIVVYGLRQIRCGLLSKLDDRLRLRRMDRASKKWVVHVARVGLAARGVVFSLIGSFLVQAALRADPSRARDFGDSIQELRGHPYGDVLLFVVAAGLFSYALYEFVRARYREIPVR